MKKIAVLIDFTPTTNNALSFAEQIALQKDFEIVLIHIHKSRDEAQVSEKKGKMEAYVSKLASNGLKCSTILSYGNFFSQVSATVTKSKASLVIIGTHGKKGIKQTLFGSNILKVVQALPVPSLVVQDHSVWPDSGFSSVLIPIDKHEAYSHKLDIAHNLLAANGVIKMYVIYVSDILEDALKTNLDKSIKYMESHNWLYEIIEEEQLVYSVGYSRQTLNYIQENKPDLVAIMAKIAPDNIHIGEMDKDNVILNPKGIPVLCC